MVDGLKVTHTVFELKQVDLVDSSSEFTGCAQDLELGAHTHQQHTPATHPHTPPTHTHTPATHTHTPATHTNTHTNNPNNPAQGTSINLQDRWNIKKRSQNDVSNNTSGRHTENRTVPAS